jgi:CubicO group peptidase (beta-lactamase class C family)
MKSHCGRISAVILMVVLGACTSTANPIDGTNSAESSAAFVAPASPSEALEHFPTTAFADISEDKVSEQTAAELQAILDDMARGAGMSATVMSPDGTWSGTTGTADGIRDVHVNDQFAIASITKSIIAAQIMQMVDAGELDLNDPVTDYLPVEIRGVGGRPLNPPAGRRS